MSDFWTALALLMVIEGILPFLSPVSMRHYMAQMIQMSDRSLRVTGLVMMLIGLVLLYLIKH